jgi:DNA-directed RNA polymerase subunit E'/Rpb7
MASKDIYITMKLQARINLPPDKIDNKIDYHLERILKQKNGDRCIGNNYVVRNSIRLLKRSDGRQIGSHFTGDLTFDINYSAKVCNPPINAKINCVIESFNKLGIIAKTGPLEIILPRENHDTKEIFESDNKILNIGDTIKVQVLMSQARFDTILVIAHYLEKVDKKQTRQFQLELSNHLDIENISVTFIDESEDYPEDFLKTNLKANLDEKISKITPEQKELVHIYSYLESKKMSDYYKIWELVHDFELLKFKDPIILAINNVNGPVQFIMDNLENYKLYGYDTEWDSLLVNDKHVLKSNLIDNAQAVKDLVSTVTKKVIKTQTESDVGSDIESDVESDVESDIESDIGYDDESEIDNKAHLIIANAEITDVYLLFLEICAIILCQRDQGNAIIKVPQLVTSLDYELLVLLKNYYDDVSIVKPRVSNNLDQTYYLVCTTFIGIHDLDKIYTPLKNWAPGQKVITLGILTGKLDDQFKVIYKRWNEIFMEAYNLKISESDKLKDTKEQAAKEWIKQNKLELTQ